MWFLIHKDLGILTPHQDNLALWWWIGRKHAANFTFVVALSVMIWCNQTPLSIVVVSHLMKPLPQPSPPEIAHCQKCIWAWALNKLIIYLHVCPKHGGKLLMFALNMELSVCLVACSPKNICSSFFCFWKLCECEFAPTFASNQSLNVLPQRANINCFCILWPWNLPSGYGL